MWQMGLGVRQFFPHGSDLEKSSEGGTTDGAVVGLVTQVVCTTITQTQMPAG